MFALDCQVMLCLSPLHGIVLSLYPLNLTIAALWPKSQLFCVLLVLQSALVYMSENMNVNLFSQQLCWLQSALEPISKHPASI